MAIEHADYFDGIERLALVTGGEIVSTFDHPEMVKLGGCKLIEEVFIGEEKMIKFWRAAGRACGGAVGATQQIISTRPKMVAARRALPCFSTIKETHRLGSGCSELRR